MLTALNASNAHVNKMNLLFKCSGTSIFVILLAVTGCLSINLIEQISRRFPGGISRKIQDIFALLWPAMQCTEGTSLPKYITKT